MIQTCKHCNVDFNTNSTAKRQAGGRINECASCVEELGTETAVKYLGFSDDDSTDIEIVSFGSDESRAKVSSAWKEGGCDIS